MTTQMQEVSKTSQYQTGESLPAKNISSVLLTDGWHAVSQCEKIEFSISSSPATDGPYTFLKYVDALTKEWTYVPLNQISGFKFQTNR